jgi:hypothetical protein
MGGEITWECLNNGSYIFTLKVYRDCNGTTIGTTAQTIEVHGHSSISSIPVYYQFPSYDISPLCNNPALQKSCGPQLANGSFGSVNIPNNNGAVEEMIWKSNPITLSGIPGPNGWRFYWSLCCRNSAISNITNPGAVGFALRSKMFAYNHNGVALNADPCFDSSPQFTVKPVTVLCSGYPYTYTNNAYDNELDSLVYSWDTSIEEYTGGPEIPVVYLSGYSAGSPFPGVSQDPLNVPATINSTTGEINYTSFTLGNFVAVVKVRAFRNGQLIAEIYREMQHVILPCGISNQAPSLSTTLNASLDTVITAGSAISFAMLASDLGTIPGNPPTPQSVAIFAASEQFDSSNYSAASVNCNRPPCAGLTSLPGVYSTTNASLQFNWQTSCENLLSTNGNYLPSKTFIFYFSAQDDYCPAPASQGRTIKITVKNLEVIAPPQPKYAQVRANGDVLIRWFLPQDSLQTFNSYLIYASTIYGGPYTLIDTITTYTTDSAIITNTTANSNPLYFYMKSRSSCEGHFYSESSDTISTVFSAARYLGGNRTEITWNKTVKNSNPTFTLFRGIANTWSQIAVLSSLNYIDSIAFCNATISYKVIENNMLPNSSISAVSSTQVIPEVKIAAIQGSPEYLNTGYIELELDGGSPPYQFLWSNGDITEKGANLAIGMYSVTVTDATGCVFSKENIEIKNEIDPNSIYEKKIFILSPNPANDYFSIFSILEGEMKVFNHKGDLVKIEKIVKGANNFSTQNIGAGSYTLKLTAESTSKKFNLIVVH